MVSFFLRRAPSVSRVGAMGVLGVGAMGVAHTIAFSSEASLAAKSTVQPLSTTIASPSRPTTVLIHGLDSSKQTWSSVLADLQRAGYPAFAVDLRGHGESPLGSPAEFSPSALAADVAACMVQQQWKEEGRRFVVVGHSMGGRIAMRLAADFPDLVQALVVEDMCTTPRVKPEPPSPGAFDAATLLKLFGDGSGGRVFKSFAKAKDTLLPWYDAARIDSWEGKRIRRQPGSGSWWSDINPLAANLARDTVLGTEDGRRAWKDLSSGGGGADGKRDFPVHLWVADRKQTVCFWEGDDGIDGMKKAMPRAAVREWPGAAHSIHNTDREEFVAALRKILDEAAAAAAAAGGSS
jgi:pimeloyl-ACP methyl ester carboxylesterase